jgi:hypothetical protein
MTTNSLRIYNHFFKATQHLVKIYSPHLNINHLKLTDKNTVNEIEKNFEELIKISSAPHFFYLRKNK